MDPINLITKTKNKTGSDSDHPFTESAHKA